MKSKYYRVLELTSDFELKPIIGELSGIDTFETEFEALQFLQDYKGGYYQLTILPVWE